MGELTNHHYEARAVFGAPMSQLEQLLGASITFEERARLVDRWLLRRTRTLSTDGIAVSANEMLRLCGRISTAAAAHGAGLSLRQFERRFFQQVGMRPKLYARIARFEAALDHKARSHSKPWSEVAREFGYHDQMHLVHDFREFSGDTPTTLLTHVESSYRAQIEVARCGRIPTALQDDSRLIM
jgi:AraC-like DNA-binding protein